MLQPKRTKYRKQHRGRRLGTSESGSQVAFGEYGLKAMEAAWISARQIEAARRVISRQFRRGAQVWIRIFPDKPVSAKPIETRQGGGKGAVDRWVAVVRRGRVMFEVGGVEEEAAKKALRLAAQKLPIPTKFTQRVRY